MVDRLSGKIAVREGLFYCYSAVAKLRDRSGEGCKERPSINPQAILTGGGSCTIRARSTSQALMFRCLGQYQIASETFIVLEIPAKESRVVP